MHDCGVVAAQPLFLSMGCIWRAVLPVERNKGYNSCRSMYTPPAAAFAAKVGSWFYHPPN